ncbi:MAG: hypothetical protein A2W91_05530 [Bacteroidetes bacterium GWF2_38_335]|nr:MAG: hypothetical protein A2W91_05530 [Bacteroidetes bacterium GWF2_38_335]HBS88095.1 hypothetical protein [Bacteroidales bacterium]
MAKFNINEIKGTSKEERQAIAEAVRQDPEIWNAVNGIGGLSEKSQSGMMVGTVTDGRDPIKDATVDASGKLGMKKSTKTNQYGFYRFELDQDLYSVTFTINGQVSDPKEIDVKMGQTTILDQIQQ